MLRWSVIIISGLLLIGFGGWVVSGLPRHAEAASVRIDPMAMTGTKTTLPTQRYDDYSLVFPSL
jgi:hypothetical protein